MPRRETKPIHTTRSCLQQLTDQALLESLGELLQKEHAIEADLLMHIGEVDDRKLYRQKAFSSMFRYCVDALHLPESVAYKRIHVARAAREYPLLLKKIASRELHLSGACLLAPHLTKDNVDELVRAAKHRSKRAIEELLAARSPKNDVPARVRKLPAPRLPETNKESLTADTQSMPLPAPACREPASSARHTEVAPLGGERFKIQFTADLELRAKLQKAMDLLGPSVSRQDLAAVFSKALDLLVSDLENKKHGLTSRPQKNRKPSSSGASRSRAIPRSVRREVYKRDGGQCAYVGDEGQRCEERSGLEYHHRLPFGLGGTSSSENIELRCKSHNQLAAEEDYGGASMSRYWKPGARESRLEYGGTQRTKAGSGSRFGVVEFSVPVTASD